jgi:hypothetical protein
MKTDGRIERWGTLSSICGDWIHVQADGIDAVHRADWPWFLAPLRAEGFLGRALARRLQPFGLPPSLETWTLEHSLFAALHTPDAPGAIVLGEPATAPLPPLDPDAQADAAAATLLAGSSAGGEQAKFLSRRADGQPLLVKFTPLRATPFGERWHDLLHAEALALETLAAAGVPVAAASVLETARRTCLVSTRFDRIGAQGRRHVVPLHAVHQAFVAGPRQHWAATVEAPVQQRRLPGEAAAQVRELRSFGHLIGNSDMHFGNLSLAVQQADVAHGRFTLAPVYDMLPMRWKPDLMLGMPDYAPFDTDISRTDPSTRAMAQVFWQRLSVEPLVSQALQGVAKTMAGRL